MKRRNKWIAVISVLVGLTVLGGYGGIRYLFDYAIVRDEKDFMSSGDASGTSEPAKPYEKWTFLNTKPKYMTQKTEDGLTLKGVYLRNNEQKVQGNRKLMILVHGYTSNGKLLEQYAKLFYSKGYDLFLPDARAHGMSEGKYIGFGWPDRIDLLHWIKQMIAYYDDKVDIGLWGISMGGAEVMMVSGEKLPKQVKCIIEDCGYSSTKEEMEYQLKEMFHLPSFPIIPLASAYTEHRVGYNFYESSAVEQLKKNHLPMLFIHGSKDDFVPTEMVEEVYEASKGPKEKVIFPGAGHAKSYQSNPKRYEKVVFQFLDQYLPVKEKSKK